MILVNEILVNFELFKFNSRLIEVENFKEYVNGLLSEKRNNDKKATHFGNPIQKDAKIKIIKNNRYSFVGRFINYNDNVIYIFAKTINDNPLYKISQEDYYL